MTENPESDRTTSHLTSYTGTDHHNRFFSIYFQTLFFSVTFSNKIVKSNQNILLCYLDWNHTGFSSQIDREY